MQLLSTVAVALLAVGGARAQSCSTTANYGPCDPVALPCADPTTTCLAVGAEYFCCENSGIITAAPTVPVVVNPVTVTSSTTCVDKLNPVTGVSDCPSRSYLCNDETYYDVMTEQCPKTCARCTGTGTTNSTSSCVDKLNPATGVSDCPARASLCNVTAYTALMTVQCPATCGRC